MLEWWKEFAVLGNFKYIKLNGMEDVLGFYWKIGWRFLRNPKSQHALSNDFWDERINSLNSINKLQNKIILHGKIAQSKLEKLYSICDYYISASEYEGFGMALANAAISNLPIISFKTSTIEKTIGKAGVLYFDNHNKDTLKDLINNNCFNNNKYKILKKNIKNKKYLTNNQSAKLFIKVINNA